MSRVGARARAHSRARGGRDRGPDLLGNTGRGDGEAALRGQRAAQLLTATLIPWDAEVDEGEASAGERLHLVRLSAVHDQGPALHDGGASVRRRQLRGVRHGARAGVRGPIPQPPPAEVAEGADDAEADVVGVPVAGRRIVSVHTDRGEREGLAGLQALGRVVVQKLAQDASEAGVQPALRRQDQAVEGSDPHQPEHLGVHEHLALAHDIDPLAVLAEIPQLEDAQEVVVRNLRPGAARCLQNLLRSRVGGEASAAESNSSPSFGHCLRRRPRAARRGRLGARLRAP
mmetsp:Transcript_6304/g.18135  ORF Transcript_6304/g.18135 Transcript_6304/m.18135 type:complete len:287 (-) Transcript_6304:238-1098(-)